MGEQGTQQMPAAVAYALRRPGTFASRGQDRRCGRCRAPPRPPAGKTGPCSPSIRGPNSPRSPNPRRTHTVPRSRATPWPADNRRVRNALRRVGRWIWSVRRLMLLAGALPILSFPAANLEFLAWFGLVPGLMLIVRSPSAPEGGVRAWTLGPGYLIAALYWMSPEIGPAVLLGCAV